VLSHGAWQRLFGGSRGIVGSIVQLDGRATRIVGVMPASFTFPRADMEMWQPFRWKQSDMSLAHYRRAHWLNVVARVKGDITPDVANQQLQVVVERLKKQYPLTNRVMGAEMVPLHTKVVGDARTPLRELHRIPRAAELRKLVVQVPGNLVRADGLTVLGVLASGLAVLAYRDRAAGSRSAIAIVGEGAVHEIGLGEHDIRVRHPELGGKACVGEVPRVRDIIRQVGDEPLWFGADP